MSEKLGLSGTILLKAAAVYKQRGLSTEGKEAYGDFVQSIINGENRALSEQIGILHGYDLFVRGEENLDALQTTSGGALLVENYLQEGPLDGFWHTILSSHLLQKHGGREARWVMSCGSNRFIRVVHQRIANTIGGIPVNDPREKGRGVVLIKRALQAGEVVAMYPEGKPARKIDRAVKGSGRLIQWAAEQGIPLISASAWIERRTLNSDFQYHDPKEILELARESSNKNEAAQKVGDYIMETIARRLPLHIQGFYRQPETSPEYFPV